MGENNKINEDTPLYSISSAARMLGVSVHTLRMYEHEGLIIPFKKESAHRLFSDTDIDRLKCIRHAITEQKFSIPSIKTIYSLIPCWNIVKCSEEDRAKCESYNGHNNPCWSYHHKDNCCSGRECRSCEVYKHYATCDKIKDAIKFKI
ncbi:MAG: MerR family transcriptional regulator [Ignavibacteriae bacterium]|nr:MerR family transcriptional regulator [Ignavibacteriota bacterium]